jgi:hypothetical protein
MNNVLGGIMFSKQASFKDFKSISTPENNAKKEHCVIKINYNIKERMPKCGHASFITVVYKI